MGKISKGKISAQLEQEEEELQAKRKAVDERELRRLTREARMMKEKKLKDAVVEKNTKVRNIIIRENDNLLSNLTLMKSKRRNDLDNKQAQNIANLFAQGDDLDEAIALEKNHIEDLENQIRKDIKQIQMIKKRKGDNVVFCSDYLHKKEKEREEKTLEAWKSRLAAEQRQLALITKENEDMRKKTHRLMKEKGQFNQLFEQLMGKLEKGKRVMADIVEQSRLKFQKRDEVVRKIEALRSKDKVDLSKRMGEMQDLEKRLYEDKRLNDFRHRVQLAREKIVGGMRSRDRETMEHQRMQGRLEKANEFWDQLKEVTGLETADEIAKYITGEDSILFSLFNFNNEIHDQLEVMMQKTAALMNTVDEEQAIAEERIENEIKARNTMEQRLEVLEQSNNDLNDHCDANSRLFSRLLDKIKILLDLMKCEPNVLEDLLGDNKKVTEFNYRIYLDMVENRLIDTLELVNLAQQLKPAHGSSNKTLSTLANRSVRAKSVVSFKPPPVLFDRKVITAPCWECELMSKKGN